MAALVSTQENRLLSEIHLCLLRYVKYNDINDGVTTGRFGKQTDMELLPWLVMHGLTWPEAVKTYAEEREAAGGEVLREFKSDEWGERQELVDMYLPNLARRVADHLGGTEYWALPPSAKVEILRFLCEVLLNTGAFPARAPRLRTASPWPPYGPAAAALRGSSARAGGQRPRRIFGHRRGRACTGCAPRLRP